ncbi:MAG TPA: four helix bundle protein [Bryobacterales bacterium]|nr:four helix bundle protein [Bryobacterales bacterium]
MSLKKFTDMDLWQVAHQMTLTIYRMTNSFPKHETYGLASQMRRCAVSVPSNVAEGWGRRSTKDFLRHLAIANGSVEELRYFLILAGDLAYCSQDDVAELISNVDRIGAMIAALERSLSKRLPT